MAIDTRNKRDSVLGLALSWRARLPVPDGTVDANDRLHIAFLYAGISAGAPAQPVAAGPSLDLVVPPALFHMTIPPALFHLTITPD